MWIDIHLSLFIRLNTGLKQLHPRTAQAYEREARTVERVNENRVIAIVSARRIRAEDRITKPFVAAESGMGRHFRWCLRSALQSARFHTVITTGGFVVMDTAREMARGLSRSETISCPSLN